MVTSTRAFFTSNVRGFCCMPISAISLFYRGRKSTKALPESAPVTRLPSVDRRLRDAQQTSV
jgi:hypothetical protein